jgi:glycerophosphoryl diester phosphodiesterase
MIWARSRELRVNVWTVDEPAEARRLMRLGVHGIITNRPALIHAALSGEDK